VTRRKTERRSGRAEAAAGETPTEGIPGYGEVDVLPLLLDRVEGDAAEVVEETRRAILEFLRARDSVALLAKSGEQLLRELVPGRIGPGASRLDQVHVELLQAFVLAAAAGRPVPASPRSMVRLWQLIMRNLAAYIAATEPGPGADADADLTRRVRLRTICYRNVFNSEDAMDVVPNLLAHMDAAAGKELGYALSHFARALFSIFLMIAERFRKRIHREEILREGGDIDGVIDGMLQGSMRAQRIWRLTGARIAAEDVRGRAAFQMAEMLCAPLFTFDRGFLVERFGDEITAALFSCALPLGGIAESELPLIYLANPVWRRPFIALEADTLFLPLPVLVISFPFAIVEGLIEGNARLQSAYSAARTRYLEDDVERIVRESLPSAAVYRSVKWTDPDTGQSFENDVVAVLGMHVLILEAKSGKLAAAARRGGLKSLKTNFRELFVEPGEQASRLEMLLARRSRDFDLIDRNGNKVRIDPAGPSVVHKFGVCLEQFASVTSSRRLFRELGLLESDQQWAPILTLAELRMISARLDSELSFLHYLTRRSTIDDMLNFVADEQDLLAMYLTNGFAFDARAFEGRQLMFLNADAAVRGRPLPRSDRLEFATPGITLSPMWRLIAKEIYEAEDRHRFDILVAILNQQPGALAEMEKKIRRWRSGAGRGQGNTLSSRAVIGERVFVVAIHMANERLLDAESWTVQSRIIGLDLAEKLGATDCVVILKSCRSAELTFDGLSFFRYPRSSSG
jgi:hypothetical protein